jgi:hypothetical protein
VQFIPFINDPKALEIMRWWQDRCIEWCFARFEDGKFGDQKYLESWPSRRGEAVRILGDSSLTLAPWNVDHILSGREPRGMFHFQGFRFFRGAVRMWRTYLISQQSYQSVKLPYISKAREILKILEIHGITLRLPDLPKDSQPASPAFQTGRSVEGWTQL